jgi:hypothetical protein
MYFHFDILLILGFNSDANSILRLLHRVDGGDVANILDAPAPSIFRGEMCKVGVLLCIYMILFSRNNLGSGGGGLVPHLGHQGQGTMKTV